MNRFLLHNRRFLTIACDESKRKAVTQKWLESIVIREKLCPFAPPVTFGAQPKLRIFISNASSHDEIVKEVQSEVDLLVGDCYKRTASESQDYPDEHMIHEMSRPETTLIVLNEEKCPSLHDFRDLVHLSWRVQTESILQHGHEKDLQIVLFHPLAKHDTYSVQIGDEEDAADYTIRSPFPIIHLLREEDVLKAVKSAYKDLEGLPSRNKAKMREQGLRVCKTRLEACWNYD